MQIHDELIIECKKEEAEQVKAIVQGCMESVGVLNDVSLNCPMKVEMEIRKNWEEKL